MTRPFSRMLIIGEDPREAVPIRCPVAGCKAELHFRTHAKKTTRISAKDNLNSHFRRLHSCLGPRERSLLLDRATEGL